MKRKNHDLNYDSTFSTHTINCVCHSIMSMFKVLSIYNFALGITFELFWNLKIAQDNQRADIIVELKVFFKLHLVDTWNKFHGRLIRNMTNYKANYCRKCAAETVFLCPWSIKCLVRNCVELGYVVLWKFQKFFSITRTISSHSRPEQFC